MKEFYDNKIILITGGCGAIGSRLAEILLAENPSAKLIAIDDLSSGNNIFISDARIEYHRDSILNRNLLEEIFRQNRVDLIFHLAANFANQNSVEHPEKDLEVNGRGTLLILDCARKFGIKKFVFTSSSCVYGAQSRPLEEEMIDIKLLDTPYALHKLLGETYCLYFHKHCGLDVSIFRIFNCYGPGEKPGRYRNVIPNFILLALNKKPLPITGTGEEERDFNYVDDIIYKMLFLAARAETAGEIYNLGSGRGRMVKEVAELINKLTDNPAGLVFEKRRGWDSITQRWADISKLKAAGYFASGRSDTSFVEGLSRNIEFINKLINERDPSTTDFSG